MRISDWSSDVCSSDLAQVVRTRIVSPHGERSRWVTAGFSSPDHPLAVEVQPSRGEGHRPVILRPQHVVEPGAHAVPSESVRRVLSRDVRSEEHTSELQSQMRISYAVFGLKKKTIKTKLIKTELEHT